MDKKRQTESHTVCRASARAGTGHSGPPRTTTHSRDTERLSEKDSLCRLGLAHTSPLVKLVVNVQAGSRQDYRVTSDTRKAEHRNR